MQSLYKNIVSSSNEGNKNLAVLIDPDKMSVIHLESFIQKVNTSMASHIFVGGSEVGEGTTEALVIQIKKYTNLPVILFPGDVIQITDKADGILFLSLISGRNPEYLIGKHVEAVSKLKKTNLEVMPCGYILIENGKKTSVERVSQTNPLKRKDIHSIIDTAKAGELLGMKLIYLEAGSGATHAIEPEIIKNVKDKLDIPLIVGGGIRTKEAMDAAHKAGADIVVIGTAFEKDEGFFDDLRK